jgi:hypothetical protein
LFAIYLTCPSPETLIFPARKLMPLHRTRIVSQTGPGRIDRVVPHRHEQASIVGADIAAPVLPGTI